MAYTIAFFGTKPYDEASFNDKNKEFGFEFRYYKGHLSRRGLYLCQRYGRCRSHSCYGSQRSKTAGTPMCRIQ